MTTVACYPDEMKVDAGSANGCELIDNMNRPSSGDQSVHVQMEEVRLTLSGMESHATRWGLDIATRICWRDYFTLNQNMSGDVKTDHVE